MALENAYLSLFHDLASVPTETVLIVMDFSKAELHQSRHGKMQFKKLLLIKLEWESISEVFDRNKTTVRRTLS